MLRSALSLVSLQLAFAHIAFAMSDDWAIADDSGQNTVTCSGGSESDSGSQMHLRLQLNGKPLDTTLHRVPGVYSDTAMITVMAGGAVVKNVPASSINPVTYSNEDGSAVFSIVGDGKVPEVDGVVLGSDGVLHVHAKGGAELEVINDGNVLGACGGEAHGGHDRRLAVERWTNCYNGDSITKAFSFGVAVGSGIFSRQFNNDHEAVTNWINSIVAEANMIYKKQLNIVLTVGQVVIQQGSQGAPSWDDPNCQLGLSNQLTKLREWQPPSQQGIWHLFDDCFGKSGNSIGLATMLAPLDPADPPGTLCMMDKVPGHNEYWNTAVTWYSSNTWKTFAHEVGHNFGGHHSFEDGQGKTGGIMDYGDGKLDGEYQFNTQYRKDQICKSIDKVIGTCSAFSDFAAGTGTTTQGAATTTQGGAVTTSTAMVPTTTSATNCDSPCADALGVSSTMTFNGVKYTNCALLISDTNKFGSGFWCSKFDAQFEVCEKSCGSCPVCTTSTEAVASTTAMPTNTPVPTTAATTASASTTDSASTTGSASTTNADTTTVPTGSGIQSGDMVFLKTRSGNGKHIDVEGSMVQARWESQGTWQAITIEKTNGGIISSGDTVYLKAHTGVHIDVAGESVEARWNDKGGWQAMIIEKKDASGPILPDDIVCFKAHTGKHLDVEDDIVRARWNACGDWQAMQIQKEIVGAVSSGDSIHLTAHTGNRFEVEGTAVQARWGETGQWQTLTIESYGGGAIFSGDAVFLMAHTGKLVDVQGVEVQARWEDRGSWQTFHIERKGGSGAVMPGDTIFLRAHTNKMVEVDGVAVQARWDDTKLWQSLVIEKATSRRLSESTMDGSALGALLGMAATVLVIGMVVLVLAIKSSRMQHGNEVKAFHQDYSYKVQPSQDEDASDVAR